MSDLDNRRPISQRDSGWARRLAASLAKGGVSPDQISASSVAFAVLGFALFALSGLAEGWGRGAALIAAAFCIQLRLLANLLDGMVAVEHGKGSAHGPIWNELPDRVADALFIVGAGYAASAAAPQLGPALGWLAAILAVTTAYVRELGRGLGFPADFSGPLAKPRRMALLTAAALVSLFEGLWGGRGEVLLIAVGLVALGSAATVVVRTRNLARRLDERSRS